MVGGVAYSSIKNFLWSFKAGVLDTPGIVVPSRCWIVTIFTFFGVDGLDEVDAPGVGCWIKCLISAEMLGWDIP